MEDIHERNKTSIKLLCTEKCKMALRHDAKVIYELSDVRDNLSETVLEPTEVRQMIFELSIN